jgi:uncharacterized protein (TIRG00374 family)
VNQDQSVAEPVRERPSWRAWFFGFMVIAALVAAVLRFGEIERFAMLLARAEPWWLMLAVALQVSTYCSLAQAWRLVLRAGGVTRPLAPLVRIAISKLFADQAVPSGGIGGNILLVDQLVRLGVPRGLAAGTLLISIVGYYAAFSACALLTLLLLWIFHQASLAVATVVSVFFFVAFGIPALVFWLGRGGGGRLSSHLHRFRHLAALFETIAAAPPQLLANRAVIAQVALWNGLLFLADAATLWVCLMALGQPTPPWIAFTALVMASIVAVLGPIPMGLGSFEATSTALLHLLGVPAETALSATLLLRIFTLWLPLIPGLVLIRQLHRKPET